MPSRKKVCETINEEVIENLTKEFNLVFEENLGLKFKIAVFNLVKENRKSDSWKNAKVVLIHDDTELQILSGNCSYEWVLYKEEGDIVSVLTEKKVYLDEKIEVPVINKRVLGKAIIKYIGNEGTEVDKKKQTLRKLLQAVIDYIQTHGDSLIWEHATVVVYDAEDNKFVFSSGKGRHRFVVNDVDGEPRVIYTINNKLKSLAAHDSNYEKKSFWGFQAFMQYFTENVPCDCTWVEGWRYWILDKVMENFRRENKQLEYKK